MMHFKRSNSPKYLLSIFMFAALLVSCNGKGKKDESKEAFNLMKSAGEVVEKSKELKEIAPVSFEEFSNWFPKNLQGMKLQKIVKGTLTGYGISGVTATYEGSDNSRLVVNVNDGAGENGTILTSQYITFKNLNTDVESDTKSEKILNSNTMVGVETVYKTEKKVLINFLYKDRFALNMQADNLEKQKVWDIFKELGINKLL